VRSSRALRTAAWVVVAAGVAAPIVRRRLGLSPAAVLASAGAAPVALCVARPRTPARDVATVCLQMWAYVAAYEMPNDDPEALRRRVRVDYPARIDRVLGLGATPTQRLQHLFSRPDEIRSFEKPLVWAHWIWFLVPHGSIAYILAFHRDRFERAAAQMYAVYDLGAIVYWALPTAPPWYAAREGRLGDEEFPRVRRMMIEYGEQFWRGGWQPLYSFLGGNPLAAMPSLHFATSLMAAHLLSEVGSVEGALGWSYAVTLGVALVYLGEHYLIDLVAGAALTEGVRRAAPRIAPALRALSRGVQALEARARA
jgi:membrane-associated phospholipid phosphatase